MALALLGVFASSAAAKPFHVLSHSFGGGELSLAAHSGVGVDQETGELYVADTGNSRIAKFTGAGVADGTLAAVPSPTFIAIDSSGGASKGDVYVVNSAEAKIAKFNPAGALVGGWATGGNLGGLGEIAGIATDSSGDLWVYNTEGLMRQFNPVGTQISEFNSGRGVEPNGIAVDAEENLYMVAGAGATKFSAAGQELIFSFGSNGGAPTALAIEPSDNSVYLGFQERVDRFTSSLPPQKIESFPGPEGTAGVAADGSSEEVFVAEPSANRVSAYALEEVGPPTVTIEPPNALTSTTAHFSGHVNPNAPVGNPAAYEVRWHFECLQGCGGVEGYIAPDSNNHLVEGTVEHLQPGTKYEVRLVAENAAETAATVPALEFKTPAVVPTVVRQAASTVFLTVAKLEATIQPGGGATTYHFDYLPKSTFEAEGFASPETRSTPEEGPLPADNAGHPVSAEIDGLVPGTAYAYRVVASNEVGQSAGAPTFFTTRLTPGPVDSSCPNQVFRIGFGAALPDCRAYEQASPVDKNGAAVEGFPGLLRAAEDGSAVSFYTQAGTVIPSDTGGAQDFSTYLATRGSGSWSSQRLLPPQQAGEKAEFVGATPDLRYAVVEASKYEAGRGLFLIDTIAHSITQIVPYESNQVGGPSFSDFEGVYAFDGASADGSRVFFETNAQLIPDAAPAVDNLYMWDRASGDVTLVGVLPGASAETPPGGSFGGAYEWFQGSDTSRGGALNGLGVDALHAVSLDGDQIFFTAGNTGQLYLRRHLDTPNPSTVHISTPNPGVTDPNGPQPAAFQEAVPDGSRVFFLSSQKLTADANTGAFDEGRDLYRWDAATESLTDVTPDVTDPNGARVQGLLGISRDGSSGYFAARGVLAPGGQPGAENLYRFSDSGGGTEITFVTALDEEGSVDRRNWSPRTYESPGTGGATVSRASRISVDGETLLFSSVRSLTGYDNQGRQPAECDTNGFCREIFRYANSSREISCISCNPTGQTPLGAALFQSNLINGGTALPGGFASITLPRNLSADGDQVFFTSPDPLVAADTNGNDRCPNFNEAARTIPACQDVYEWEAPDPADPSNTCTPQSSSYGAASGGCLYLLSTGKSERPSFFVDASSDGTSAFIVTDSQLVPSDHDNANDAYDVRVGGGLASQQGGPPARCEGEAACQGAVAPPPGSTSPGSASFNGPGNAKPHKNKKKHQKKKAHKKSKAHKKQSKKRTTKSNQGGGK
jgi:hypothetical protein